MDAVNGYFFSRRVVSDFGRIQTAESEATAFCFTAKGGLSRTLLITVVLSLYVKQLSKIAFQARRWDVLCCVQASNPVTLELNPAVAAATNEAGSDVAVGALDTADQQPEHPSTSGPAAKHGEYPS